MAVNRNTTVHQGPWDVVEHEPEISVKDIERHGTAVQKAVEDAKGHADKAREAADRLDRLEALLERAEALGRDVQSHGERSGETLTTVAKAVQALAERMERTHGEGMQRVAEALKAATAPRKIIRDKDGRASGVEVTR